MSDSTTQSAAERLDPEHYALILRGLRRMLRPVIYLLMKFRVPYKTLQKLTKQLYVDAATRAFQIPGTATTQARVVMLTGLTRPDVRSLMKESARGEPQVKVSPLAPVVVLSAWANDARYAVKEGPRVLPLRGPFPSFQALVTELKLDVSYGALAEELDAAGCIEIDADQNVTLCKAFYLPNAPSPVQLVNYALTVEALSNTINDNVLKPSEPHLYQRQYWTRAIEPDQYGQAKLELQALLQRQSEEVIELLEKFDAGHAEPHHLCLGAGAYLFNQMEYEGLEEAVQAYTD